MEPTAMKRKFDGGATFGSVGHFRPPRARCALYRIARRASIGQVSVLELRLVDVVLMSAARYLIQRQLFIRRARRRSAVRMDRVRSW